MQVTKFETLESKLIKLRDTFVLVDKDVATLFGVETRDINKAVKNNPLKFPNGYIIGLDKNEKKNWWKNSTGSINSNIQQYCQKLLQKKAYI